jgi:HSP20 family protein
MLPDGATRKEEIMAELIRKNPNPIAWDPFETMRDLLRWDPFREMAPVGAIAPRIEHLTWMPGFEVRESKDAYVFKADLPGVKTQDLDVSLTGNRLQVTGRREEEKEAKDDTYYAYERAYGEFTRSFTLPDGIDAEHVKSELAEGVLTIVVPKRAAAQARKIPIAATTTKS